MKQNTNIPTLNQVASFLDEHGWTYKESVSENGQKDLFCPYTLRNQNKAILLSFSVIGEYVMVSTVNFLGDVPIGYSPDLLYLNDTLKLVKLYSVSPPDSKTINIEVGFELWSGSWNKETFFAFMDSLCMCIETVFEIFEKDKIPHNTKFISYTTSPQ